MITEGIDVLSDAADALAKRRVDYSQQFQIAKNRGATDELAHQVAIEATEGEVEILETIVWSAKQALKTAMRMRVKEYGNDIESEATTDADREGTEDTSQAVGDDAA